MKKNSLLASIIVMFCSFILNAEDSSWITWRGPRGDSTYNSTKWSPKVLTKTLPKVWQINVGKGFSGIAVQGDRFFTMGNSAGQDTVFCLNLTTGKEIWKYSYKCGSGEYPGPRATPVLEGDKLYTLSLEGHLFCLEASTGKVLWQKSLREDFGAAPPRWSFAGTPLIYGNMLVLNANQYGIALDKATGKTLWTSPKGVGGYATPVVYSQKEKTYVAIFGQRALYGVELKSGKKSWEYPWQTAYDVNAADPLVVGDKIFIASGYSTGCALIDISGSTPKKIWQNKAISAHFSSFVFQNGYIYASDGNAGERKAGLTCVELETGKVMWKQSLGMGSLLASNGMLIYYNERGMLYIAELKNSAYTQLAEIQTLRGTCWTPPIMHIDKLFLRNDRGDILNLNLAK